MTGVRIDVDENPKRADTARLTDGLNEHAKPFTDVPGFEPIAVYARDDGGELVGGILGYLNWRWLHISLLWVGAEQRGKGLGSKLLVRLEAEAFDRGCRHAHLDTLGFQARPFYESHGYEMFAALDDYPGEHQRVFMRKELPGEDAS